MIKKTSFPSSFPSHLARSTRLQSRPQDKKALLTHFRTVNTTSNRWRLSELPDALTRHYTLVKFTAFLLRHKCKDCFLHSLFLNPSFKYSVFSIYTYGVYFKNIYMKNNVIYYIHAPKGIPKFYWVYLCEVEVSNSSLFKFHQLHLKPYLSIFYKTSTYVLMAKMVCLPLQPPKR